MLYAHGMVGNVFVKIGEDQQQLKHAITLFRLRFVSALFQILHGSERIESSHSRLSFVSREPSRQRVSA